MKHTALLSGLGITAALIKERRLTPCSEPREVVVAERGADGREHLLTPEAAAAWNRMRAAANADGVALFIMSGFRSIDRQAGIIRRKLGAGQTLEQILSVSAPPGFSEHHTGCAIDVGTSGCANLEEAFEATDAFQWLRRRAGEFGFTLSYPRGNAAGYRYEPWHWRYVG